MKSIFSIVAVLVFAGNCSAAMNDSEKQKKFENTLDITTTIALEVLKEKADKGDMKSALAYADFFEQLKNPNYVIDCKDSKEELQESVLIDSNGKIIQAVRELFENK